MDQKLLENDYIQYLNKMNKIIKPLKNRLLDRELDNQNNNHFSLYLKFLELCKLRQKLKKIDFYGSDNETIFKITHDVLEFENELNPLSESPAKRSLGFIFKQFIEILKGTLFETREGRCTRGVYASFVKSNIQNIDYILLIDTEGLLSVETIIVNILGDVNEGLKYMITLCTDSLKQLKVNKVPKPTVQLKLYQKQFKNYEDNLTQELENLFKLENTSERIRERSIAFLKRQITENEKTLTKDAAKNKFEEMWKKKIDYIESVTTVASFMTGGSSSASKIMTRAAPKALEIDFRKRIRDAIITELRVDPLHLSNILQLVAFFDEIYQQLTKLVEDKGVLHPAEIDLIQKIANFINAIINDINLELNVFGLSLSMNVASVVHSNAFLLLTALYYREQQHLFNEQIHTLTRQKSSPLNYFNSMIVPDAAFDNENGEHFVKDLSSTLIGERSLLQFVDELLLSSGGGAEENLQNKGQCDENNRYSCSTGHQLRAFAGIKFEVTNEASLYQCNEIDNNSHIVVKGIRKNCEEMKLDYQLWDFNLITTADESAKLNINTRRTNSDDDRITIITFTNIAKMFCSNQKMKDIDTKNIAFTDGTTAFGPAFQLVIKQ
ncbi:unnamed protein product [Didymodactylos carnosus]|uniref:Uncharacterized protein n=1 Tax=Didymodactylos carnosus TaxID=1234261 RepID=A0A813UF03_9BILA|nr:unnamed protein product [Didymodactylos carnosus]CAF3609095.1 unnamed protein product [Didymodactylos carnosus]